MIRDQISTTKDFIILTSLSLSCELALWSRKGDVCGVRFSRPLSVLRRQLLSITGSGGVTATAGSDEDTGVLDPLAEIPFVGEMSTCLPPTEEHYKQIKNLSFA